MKIDQIILIIDEVGYPVLMAIGMGYFIWYVWKYVTKELKPKIDKVITLGKKKNLQSKKNLFTKLQNKASVDKLTKQNLDNAKQEYLDAVQLAKTKPRPKATITKDPSFATQDPMDLLPRRYNPDTGAMDIV